MYRRIAKWLVLLLALGLSGVAAAHAKPEGTVVIGLPSLGAEDWLVPARPQANAIAIVPVFNTLLERDDKTGKPAPGLATKPGSSRQTARRGPSICAGTSNSMTASDFTAEDVKFSYEVALRPDSTSDMKGVFTNFVQEVEVVNPSRVVFHMKAPNWEILYKFLETPPFFPIVSKKYFDKVGWQEAGRQPVGTGSVPVRRAQARRVRPAGGERRVLERRAASEDADHPWRAGRSDAGRIAADGRVESGADRLRFAVEGPVGRAQGDPLRKVDADGRGPRRPVPTRP